MNSREIALKVLIDMREKGAYSNYSINKYLKEKINPKDENLVREIVYGVIENLTYIDYIISKLSTKKIEKIHPKILDILRIGVYQIAFTDKIPDRAAVNESVNLAKKYVHGGAAGFVNGILRNFSRRKAEMMKIESGDKLEFLSIKYSHPKWMVKRWIKAYGEDFTERLLNANNSKPKLNLRVNTLKTDKDTLKQALTNYGYEVHDTKYAKDGIVVENPVRITDIDEFIQGHFTIQDESSMLVAQIANPKEDSVILDLCSAPGGKATHLAQIMNNKGRIICWDIYEHKLELVRENASRLGINIIETKLQDAQVLDESMIGIADICIVDAPCSGLGIIRRRPEIKWNRKEEDIEDLVKIQKNILNNASKYVKPGGLIIYSTCTIEENENMNTIEEFLNKNKDFTLSPFDQLISFDENMSSSKEGYIQMFPNIHGTDGFFISRIKKKNS
jgi:16S rRNA (cytosine967-C5)-methyltransferase